MAEETVLFHREEENVSLVANSEVSHRYSINEDDETESASEFQTVELDESEADEKERDGVYEYENALRYIGFGPFHLLILLGTGLALASDSSEVIGVSYILEKTREDFYTENDGYISLRESALSVIIFIGMMIGGYAWGSLSDLTGRRRALLMSLTLNGAAGIVSSLWRNYYFFLFCRFISGIGVGGSLPVVFAYCAEFIDSKRRAKYLAGLSSFWILGQMYAAGMAWMVIPREELRSDFLHTWQIFTIIAAVPSLSAAVLYLFLPESPKFLHQTGKTEKAVSVLRIVFKLNRRLMCKQVDSFLVKSIATETKTNDAVTLPKCMRYNHVCARVPSKVKLVVWRTLLLFHCKYLRCTLLYLGVYFCLAFGSYGTTLWYPTYISSLNTAAQKAEKEELCSRAVGGGSVDAGTLPQLCGCTYAGALFENMTIGPVHLTKSSFLDSAFRNVTFQRTALSDVAFGNCSLNLTNFSNVTMENVVFKFTSTVKTVYSAKCPLTATNGCHSGSKSTIGRTNFDSILRLWNVTVLNESSSFAQGNSCVSNIPSACAVTADEYRVYREAFIFAASAIPGTIITAIVVDLRCMWRSLWITINLSLSALSLFLLLIPPDRVAVSAETLNVILFSIFNGISKGVWNTLALLSTELFPTLLRTTASAVGLVSVRIGAILGISLFGLLVATTPAVPIIIVAILLSLGAVLAVLLPKTTKGTRLE